MPTFSDRVNDSNVYCCVLARGTNPMGRRAYAYFGVFLRDLRNVMRTVGSGKPFNPKDFNTIVLARGEGEPDPEIKEFMQRKFSFSDSQVILEVSH
jgi:hypothetical protein